MAQPLFLVMLVAALMHATWNALIKAADNKPMLAIGISACAALIALLCLPWMQRPALASLPWLATSCILQVTYTLLVAQAYQIADMSQIYPVMRGSAPLILALFSVGFLHESLSKYAWYGIAIICLAIIVIGLSSGRHSLAKLALALTIAVFIASYTLIDAIGVRRSEAILSYTLWSFLLNGAALALWGIYRMGSPLIRYCCHHWRLEMAGGACTIGAYGIALWAMTRAPVAVVAALRESSILFAILISILVLDERPRMLPILAACGIAAGAIILRIK